MRFRLSCVVFPGKQLLICSLLLFVGSLCLPVSAADVTERFGNTNNTRLIASAPIVKAWRTEGSLKGPDYLGEALYKRAGEAMNVSTNLARELGRILLDEHTYFDVDGAVKSAVSWPCIVVRFADAHADLDVFFSFRDNSISVKVGVERFGSPLLVESSVDPSRAKLLAIMKQVFPKDPDIQALPEKQP